MFCVPVSSRQVPKYLLVTKWLWLAWGLCCKVCKCLLEHLYSIALPLLLGEFVQPHLSQFLNTRVTTWAVPIGSPEPTVWLLNEVSCLSSQL